MTYAPMRGCNPFIVLLLSALTVGHTGCSQDLKWSAVESLINSDFPDVTSISGDSLARALSDTFGTPVILFDARTRAEYDVSHIPGAVHLDPTTTDFSFLDTLDQSTPIVTYCSVGYRSAQMAARLNEAGFENASNLQGSIFEWANEGRTVVRNGEPVREVHPYDRIWGQLLDPELKAYAPGGSSGGADTN